MEITHETNPQILPPKELRLPGILLPLPAAPAHHHAGGECGGRVHGRAGTYYVHSFTGISRRQ